MIGAYWSTGITVSYQYAGNGAWGWSGKVDFYDDGFMGYESTQGTLLSRRTLVGPGALGRLVDLMKADAERLGIEFRVISGQPPALWVPGDAEDDPATLPAGWQQQLATEADRLGWKSIYQVPTDA